MTEPSKSTALRTWALVALFAATLLLAWLVTLR